MKEILEKLKQNQIVSPRNVSDLRNYISIKYPNLSPRDASILLVNTIHKIIDNSLLQFDTENRYRIRQAIISNSAHKNSFIITADEILFALTDIYEDEKSYIDNLLAWIKDNQDIKVAKEQLLDVIDEIKNLDAQYLNEDIQPELEAIIPNNENSEVISNVHINRIVVNKHLGIVICVFLITLFSMTMLMKDNKTESLEIVAADKIIETETRNINELPAEFKYKKVEAEELRNWLNSRDSRLADEPYLTAIISAAEEFDINPILMIAITGQEQGFVPRSHEYADKIANNPFNVHGSWIDYNTDIFESSRIAAITIVNLSKNRPSNMDTIQWINRKYAEDQNWHKGVSRIFHMISEELAKTEKSIEHKILLEPIFYR